MDIPHIRSIENVRSELYCHQCGRYVQFATPSDVSGNIVLECPICGHEHCRVVRNGIVTEERWAQRNRPVFRVSSTGTTSSSVYDNSNSLTWRMRTYGGTTSWTTANTVTT